MWDLTRSIHVFIFYFLACINSVAFQKNKYLKVQNVYIVELREFFVIISDDMNTTGCPLLSHLKFFSSSLIKALTIWWNYPYSFRLPQISRNQNRVLVYSNSQNAKSSTAFLSQAAANAERIRPNHPTSRPGNRIRVSAPRLRRSLLTLLALFAFGTGVTESFEVIDAFIQEL